MGATLRLSQILGAILEQQQKIPKSNKEMKVLLLLWFSQCHLKAMLKVW